MTCNFAMPIYSRGGLQVLALSWLIQIQMKQTWSLSYICSYCETWCCMTYTAVMHFGCNVIFWENIVQTRSNSDLEPSYSANVTYLAYLKLFFNKMYITMTYIEIGVSVSCMFQALCAKSSFHHRMYIQVEMVQSTLVSDGFDHKLGFCHNIVYILSYIDRNIGT